MSAAPWYLLAGGIGLVIVGYFLGAFGSRGSGRRFIDPKMSDQEIARQVNEGEALPVGSLVILVGFLAILVSVVWRIVRFFV
jgi:hypothetical protein